VANAMEACRLSNADDPAEAARRLASRFTSVVVTLGAAGALAFDAGELARVPAPSVEVHDTTGAGDLFCAAYVWANLAGLPVVQRLEWAVLYASHSVRAATAYAGAMTLAELERAGRAAGLELPVTNQPSLPEERR
jgi:sugar/nucleoside kinase (ribokinase family)